MTIKYANKEWERENSAFLNPITVSLYKEINGKSNGGLIIIERKGFSSYKKYITMEHFLAIELYSRINN